MFEFNVLNLAFSFDSMYIQICYSEEYSERCVLIPLFLWDRLPRAAPLAESSPAFLEGRIAGPEEGSCPQTLWSLTFCFG